MMENFVSTDFLEFPRPCLNLFKLNTLKLTRCSPLQDDDFLHFDELLDLRELSIVKCGLTKIPEKVLDTTWLEVLNLELNSIQSIPYGTNKL